MKDGQIGPCAGHLLPDKPPRHSVADSTDSLLRAVVLWVTGLGAGGGGCAAPGWVPSGSGRMPGWSWNHRKAPLYAQDGALTHTAGSWAGCPRVCTWLLCVAQAPRSQAAGIQQQKLQETGSGRCPSLKARAFSVAIRICGISGCVQVSSCGAEGWRDNVSFLWQQM